MQKQKLLLHSRSEQWVQLWHRKTFLPGKNPELEQGHMGRGVCGGGDHPDGEKSGRIEKTEGMHTCK